MNIYNDYQKRRICGYITNAYKTKSVALLQFGNCIKQEEKNIIHILFLLKYTLTQGVLASSVLDRDKSLENFSSLLKQLFTQLYASFLQNATQALNIGLFHCNHGQTKFLFY